MNQIKQKIKEIGLSQREISKRLGENASYLAGVFRTGLSTAKQAELLKDLEVVVGGGTVQSDDQIIAELSQKLTRTEDKYLETHKVKERQAFKIDDQDKIIADLSWRLNCCQDGNNQLRDRLSESQSYLREANSRISVLSKCNDHLKEGNSKLRNESGNYLIELEQIESKYRFVLIFNYLLSLAILGIAISWVLK